jgi:hypothetical protein
VSFNSAEYSAFTFWAVPKSYFSQRRNPIWYNAPNLRVANVQANANLEDSEGLRVHQGTQS